MDDADPQWLCPASFVYPCFSVDQKANRRHERGVAFVQSPAGKGWLNAHFPQLVQYYPEPISIETANESDGLQAVLVNTPAGPLSPEALKFLTDKCMVSSDDSDDNHSNTDDEQEEFRDGQGIGFATDIDAYETDLELKHTPSQAKRLTTHRRRDRTPLAAEIVKMLDAAALATSGSKKTQTPRKVKETPTSHKSAVNALEFVRKTREMFAQNQIGPVWLDLLCDEMELSRMVEDSRPPRSEYASALGALGESDSESDMKPKVPTSSSSRQRSGTHLKTVSRVSQTRTLTVTGRAHPADALPAADGPANKKPRTEKMHPASTSASVSIGNSMMNLIPSMVTAPKTTLMAFDGSSAEPILIDGDESDDRNHEPRALPSPVRLSRSISKTTAHANSKLNRSTAGSKSQVECESQRWAQRYTCSAVARARVTPSP